jgi:ATP-dependent RNA helicase DHX37/DHR1
MQINLHSQVHASLGNFSSDMFRLLSNVGAYEYAGGGHKFCAEHFLRPKVRDRANGYICQMISVPVSQAMEEIHKLRAQISHIVQANFQDIDVGFVSNLRPPNDLQVNGCPLRIRDPCSFQYPFSSR